MILLVSSLCFEMGQLVPLYASGAWFLFNALKSRTFSPLNASRPKLANEKSAIAERKRPSWMPPPLAGLLRHLPGGCQIGLYMGHRAYWLSSIECVCDYKITW